MISVTGNPLELRVPPLEYGHVMGSEIRITCNGCAVDLTEIVGVGFVGVEHLVLCCDSCGTFTRRENAHRWTGTSRPKYRCGRCRKLLRVVAPRDDESGDDEGPLGPCPICGHVLSGESTGLMWD